MSNRFGRDPSRTSLFSAYDSRSTSPSKGVKPARSSSNLNQGYGYAYTPPASSDSNAGGPAFGAYPGSSANGGLGGMGMGGNSGGMGGFGENGGMGGYRTATPNKRGQYSDAVMDELESQNEDQVGVLSGKVAELKNLTSLIGDEIRSSSALAEKMNDQFENSRLKIKGTMNRMLRMAKKTGVGWKVWLAFFFVVGVLFWYVWLF